MGTAGTHTITQNHSVHKHIHKPKIHKHTSPDRGGNGLAELNKCNHCDQSRCDILKCDLLFSLPFSITVSLLPPPHLVSVSTWVTLESHSSALFLLFPPHYSLFFTFAFHSSPSFDVFFLYLLWLFLILFDPCVKSVLGRASRSPCCYDRGLAAEWRWPLNSQALTLLFFPCLSFSLISTHSLASFHLWTSVPARVNHRADMEGTGVNWEYVLNKKNKLIGYS